MATLLIRASLVPADSGGLQKEASWAKVPGMTPRTDTEWIGTEARGRNVVFGGGMAGIQDWSASLAERAEWVPPPGEGNAAKRIVEAFRTCEPAEPGD